MRYAIAAVRPSAVSPAAGDDGLLHPIPGVVPDTVELEARDGTSPRQLAATEIVVRPLGDSSPILRCDDIRAQVYVTDARVALACTDYDTGGGWIGGPIALALNVTSRARAAKRRRGQTLVGHVRYPWLRGAYARDSRRRGGTELLRLAVEGEDGVLELDLTLPRGSGATAVATDILRRAARFRLDYDEDASAQEREELEQLAALAPLQWTKGEPLAGRALPTFWPPTARSALLGLPEPAVRSPVSPAPRAAPPRPVTPASLAARREPASHSAPPEDVRVVLRRPPAAQDDDVEVTLRPRPEQPRGDDPS